MGDDLLRQYQLALLVDFYPIQARLIRLAGLDREEIQAGYDGFHLIPSGTPERYMSSYRWGMSIIALVLEKYGSPPADAAISAALEEVHEYVERMKAGGI